MKILSIALVAAMAVSMPMQPVAAATGSGACICTISAPAGALGSVATLKGDASLSMAGSSGFEPLALGDKLPDEGEVRTGSDSATRLLLADGCQIDMVANASVTFSTLGGSICVSSSLPVRIVAEAGVTFFQIGTDLPVDTGQDNPVSQ